MEIDEETENVNILDSYALVASTVQVPIKFSFIGRLSASPGFHYVKIAHRLKILVRKQLIIIKNCMKEHFMGRNLLVQP